MVLLCLHMSCILLIRFPYCNDSCSNIKRQLFLNHYLGIPLCDKPVNIVYQRNEYMQGTQHTQQTVTQTAKIQYIENVNVKCYKNTLDSHYIKYQMPLCVTVILSTRDTEYQSEAYLHSVSRVDNMTVTQTDI